MGQLTSDEKKEVLGQSGIDAGKGALAGAAAGTMVMPGVGTLVGAGIGALAGFASSYIGGRKQQILENKAEAADAKAASQAKMAGLAAAAATPGVSMSQQPLSQVDNNIMSVGGPATPGPSGYDAWKQRTYGGV